MKRFLPSIIVTIVSATLLASGASAQRGSNAFGATEAHFPDGVDQVVIPFEYTLGKIIIPVSVNGSPPLRFVLDTGAPVGIISGGELANSIDLDIVGSAMVGGAGSDAPQSVPMAANVTFDIGGVEFKGGRLAIGVAEDLLSRANWQGVVGGPVFWNAVVEIDFMARELTIYDRDSFEYDGDGVAVPLEIVHGFPYVDLSIQFDGQGEVPITSVVDIGASHSLSLDAELTRGLDMPQRRIDNAILGFGASGAIEGSIGRADRVTLAGQEFAGVVVEFPGGNYGGIMGPRTGSRDATANMGTELLERFTVIFDYERERMILEANERGPEPFKYTRAGVRLWPWKAGDRAVAIARVLDGSPAARAGIEDDDQLVAVDGRELAVMTPTELYDLMRGDPGTVLVLTIERDGQQMDKSISLKKLI